MYALIVHRIYRHIHIYFVNDWFYSRYSFAFIVYRNQKTTEQIAEFVGISITRYYYSYVISSTKPSY